MRVELQEDKVAFEGNKEISQQICIRFKQATYCIYINTLYSQQITNYADGSINLLFII